MRKFFIEEKLEKSLSKLWAKDRHRYDIIMKKIQEILTCNDVDHYKNLKAPLQHLKRVHVNTQFVLVFKYNRENDTVIFYDVDHHDSMYR
jgi:YafQ family addiction module toxin component